MDNENVVVVAASYERNGEDFEEEAHEIEESGEKTVSAISLQSSTTTRNRLNKTQSSPQQHIQSTALVKRVTFSEQTTTTNSTTTQTRDRPTNEKTTTELRYETIGGYILNEVLSRNQVYYKVMNELGQIDDEEDEYLFQLEQQHREEKTKIRDDYRKKLSHIDSKQKNQPVEHNEKVQQQPPNPFGQTRRPKTDCCVKTFCFCCSGNSRLEMIIRAVWLVISLAILTVVLYFSFKCMSYFASS